MTCSSAIATPRLARPRTKALCINLRTPPRLESPLLQHDHDVARHLGEEVIEFFSLSRTVVRLRDEIAPQGNEEPRQAVMRTQEAQSPADRPGGLYIL